MAKNLYLFQASVSNDSSFAYLPYSAGCIAAYALKDEAVKTEYCLREIYFRRENADKVVARLDNPFVAAFSAYVWNIEYSLLLARKIKEKYPDCKIIFGGHQVADNTEMLENHTFIDFLIHGEGEVVFTELLKNFDSPQTVDGISYRDGDKCVMNKAASLPDLLQMPSPYLDGVFEKLMQDYPDCDFSATLETNRGCPYACAYCDWCEDVRVREFPLEKVMAEIDWIADKKISYCYCADANFGIIERDVSIAAYVVKKRDECGYPRIFKPCYAKNSDNRVFEAGRLLNENGADKGVTLAYQSLNDTVLENIGRKNMGVSRFHDLAAKYNAAGIPTYTELILGLPGETCESFCRGICDLLEAGQHNSMTVYECQVYPRALVGDKAYQQKHGIKTAKIPMHGIHYSPDFNGVDEFYEIIVSTRDMSFEKWLQAYMFSVILQSFHHLGMLRCFAVYLRYEKNVSYYDFYTALYNYIFENKETFIYGLFDSLRQRRADLCTADWTFKEEPFGNVGFYFEEGAFLKAATEIDTVFAELRPFLEGFGIENDVFDALFDYQRAIIRLPEKNELSVLIKYDFYNYFNTVLDGGYNALQKADCRLEIECEKAISSWEEYAREIIWYGKRRSATLMTNKREKVRCSYEV